jgi:exopolyphosphatase / guanosine-5'-triphosphate,3'-diphosphate pyrophosphatase
MKIAVIDLGTNGFRLQIAETFGKGSFNIIHREANELKLAADGIHLIGEQPFKRGLETMKLFAEVLKQHQVTKVNAFGTAALRMAENGQDFIEAVKQETSINIELISGDREAELIYKGMKMAIPLGVEPVLMIDVGGGSVEFIICNEEQVFWAKSLNVGVAILKQNFHVNDPITNSEIAKVEEFLNETLSELSEKLDIYKPSLPIFACGTLDFIVKFLQPRSQAKYFEISRQQYDGFYEKLTFMSTRFLKNMPGVPRDKIEMLAVSMILMDWILKKVNADKLITSTYSMKAGILYEMANS